MGKGAQLSTAYLGLGSNLGDRLAYLRRAVAALAGYRSVELDVPGGVASLYESGPVGGPAGQGAYLNSVVRVQTSLSVHELLGLCLGAESELGRVRKERNGPRVIDIDLLLFDDAVIDEPGLTVPHPRLHTRLFVLEPLAELASMVVHPRLGLTVGELRERCAGAGDSPDAVTRVSGSLWVLPGGGAEVSSASLPASMAAQSPGMRFVGR